MTLLASKTNNQTDTQPPSHLSLQQSPLPLSTVGAEHRGFPSLQSTPCPGSLCHRLPQRYTAGTPHTKTSNIHTSTAHTSTSHTSTAHTSTAHTGTSHTSTAHTSTSHTSTTHNGTIAASAIVACTAPTSTVGGGATSSGGASYSGEVWGRVLGLQASSETLLPTQNSQLREKVGEKMNN